MTAPENLSGTVKSCHYDHSKAGGAAHGKGKRNADERLLHLLACGATVSCGSRAD